MSALKKDIRKMSVSDIINICRIDGGFKKFCKTESLLTDEQISSFEQVMIRMPLKDTLNTCQTNKSLNKICQKQSFWRAKYFDYLGIPIEEQTPNPPAANNWKEEFLKLNKQLITFIDQKDYQSAIKYAASQGYSVIVERLLSRRFRRSSDRVLLYHRDSLNAVNTVLYFAALGGQQKILDRMLDLGATDFNHALEAAAKSGQQYIVNQMLDLGATAFNDALKSAALGGHQTIVNQMLSLLSKQGIEPDYNGAFIAACYGGQEVIMDQIMSEAIYHCVDQFLTLKGHIYCVDINRGLIAASGAGHLSIVKNLLVWGADNYKGASSIANKNHHYLIVQELNKYYENLDLVDRIINTIPWLGKP